VVGAGLSRGDSVLDESCDMSAVESELE
jgi:hypothetical protein